MIAKLHKRKCFLFSFGFIAALSFGLISCEENPEIGTSNCNVAINVFGNGSACIENFEGNTASVPYGNEITVVATPESGNFFIEWYINGIQVSTVSTYTFTVLNNISLTARFSTWQSIGKALYTEDVAASPGFGLQCLTYEVEVEQALENPNIIRMKNAYGAAFPYNAPGDYDTKKDYYITFNCEDPEGVYIDGWCEMGMDWGYGMFSMTSYGYYMMANGYSFDEVKAAGYMGTLDENLCITFPVNGLVMQMADWGMTYANKNGAFKLDLSTTTIAE